MKSGSKLLVKKKTDVGGQKRHFKKAHRAGGTEINLHLNHTAS
jgi:hypothetical protein